jgi:hypothetical protein
MTGYVPKVSFVGANQINDTSFFCDQELLKTYGTHFALRFKRKTKFVFDFWSVSVVGNNKLRI